MIEKLLEYVDFKKELYEHLACLDLSKESNIENWVYFQENYNHIFS